MRNTVATICSAFEVLPGAIDLDAAYRGPALEQFDVDYSRSVLGHD